ncbi:Atxe2 family lasso peptide isopeptidase [Asticcacaulis sp.]|uniref:Atxe2 family lasso peptide isopeptidase n=1 Tax=Asticcacaulis sp. TaxID=1872648 RepID=UPI003F7C08B6
MLQGKTTALLCLLLGAVIPSLSIAGPCDGFLPEPGTQDAQRDIEASDLVRLRDIGPVMAHDTEAEILTLSPDGTRAAFQLRRADPVSNTYCLGMIVLPTAPNGSPVLVDQGGEFIPETRTQDGFAQSTPSGAPLLITPKWSPDGQSIAYLRRDYGITQVWKARADGSGASAITRSIFDIETFDWSPDGRALVVSGRPSIPDAELAIKKEASSGFLYDDRFVPIAGNRPKARGVFPLVRFSVDATGSGPHALVPLPAELSNTATGTPSHASRVTRVGTSMAWTAPVDPLNLISDVELHVRFAGRPEAQIVVPHTQRISGIWFSSDGNVLYFMRTEGWGHGWHASEQGLYRLDRTHSAPTRIVSTNDVLMGCQIDGSALICGEESSTIPRRIVRLDLRTGQQDTLFDPNPEFQALRLGPVQRLIWKNAFGYEAFGDLVLPPDHKPGEKHPLVVVQYFSRGFLRGGTGDDYPVFLLASQGFAVLDFEMPPNYSSLQSSPVRSGDELGRIDFQDWQNRKHVLSSLEQGIAAAIDTGAVDQEKIGLTGLSDGFSTALYALFNGHVHYSAMAISTCCGGRTVTGMLDGPAPARYYQAMGYPKLTEAGSAFWHVFSMRENAERMNTPLLIQVPDDEYLGALEGFTALRELGKPAEMYVYPDEHHIKWQPAHRLATYSRAVDWFKFWLLDHTDTTAEKADQYRRWQAMRDTLPKDIGSSQGAR